MKRNRKPQFSTEQTVYMIAKAQLDALYATLNERTTDLDWDSDFENAHNVNETIRTELHIDEAFRTLQVAEDALINWGIKSAQKIAKTADDKATLDYLLNEAIKQYRVKARKMVIDLTMKLQA